ncbi:MAG: glycosyltransferase family 4 protein [Bacteroidales bacterium]|nr:glycosyltransferase family 4 protein [Bacteroidales bacterium]
MRSYFENYFKTTNIKVIPNGIHTGDFNMDGITEKQYDVIHIGRLTGRKNIELLFEVAKKLPFFKFLVIGTGEYYLKSDLGNITFLGYIPNAQLSEYFSKAKIAFFPSTSENLPMVGLESMACGIPVVAYAQGFKEYILDGVNGFILESLDVNYVSNKLTAIINDTAQLKKCW